MAAKITELRKIYSAQGIKGFSSANREAFNADIEAAWDLALLSEASRESAKQVKPVKVGRKGRVLDNSPEAKARRSRAGMVIVAKGTEVHKSLTFKAAAEAAGWTVTIEHTEMDEIDEDTDEPMIRYRALATRGGAMVEGSWVGKAWDYPNASAGIGGKARKVRNLKEALRILAGQA